MILNNGNYMEIRIRQGRDRDLCINACEIQCSSRLSFGTDFVRFFWMLSIHPPVNNKCHNAVVKIKRIKVFNSGAYFIK